MFFSNYKVPNYLLIVREAIYVPIKYGHKKLLSNAFFSTITRMSKNDYLTIKLLFCCIML